MPDQIPLNAKDDSVAEILAVVHPARPSTAVSTTVTNAWATHDFHAPNPFRVVNAYGFPIPWRRVVSGTGFRNKYYPQTVDEKAILDYLVSRGDMYYQTVVV